MSASVAEIEELARQLWGPPNPKHSTREDLRFGQHGSKSVRIKDAVWHDHETGEGGGYAALYEKVHGERPADASIIATYDYQDADGALLFQVVRKVPKKFLQRRPDGNDGWIWDMRGIHRVPYRLPELLRAAAHATVFICEGEKDCDALHERGLIATTNPGGAGKWQVAMSQHLRGRDVVILPDNDQAGEDHATEVMRKLQGIARSVGIIRLPDLPPKGDVSDWIAGGGTAEELERFAADHGHEAEQHSGADGIPDLRALLSIAAWADRPMPAPDRLLGDLITTTTRTFFVGPTGLGKTMLGFAIARGIADGAGFLHWRSIRPARVLYVDGEMPGELIKARSIDTLRRGDIPPPPHNLMIYSAELENEISKHFPALGTMMPLNTEAGMNFVLALIEALGGVDVVIFDNVMSLVVGDQKDEVPWSETMPLIATLTRKRIGQVWLDHTGHDKGRQYGSATKAWRFDAVGLMAPLPDDQRDRHEVAFTLSFEPPGKARRRTPDNWQDFETCTIRLKEDRWTSDISGSTPRRSRVSPMCEQFHRALIDAVALSATGDQATRDAWFDECARLGLVAPLLPADSHAQRERKRGRLRKYMAELKAAGWIGVDGETVRSLNRGGQ